MARSRCTRTGKAKFPSELEANLAMVDTHRSNTHHRHRKFREEPTRAYECEFGDHWHLTSQPERQSLTG